LERRIIKAEGGAIRLAVPIWTPDLVLTEGQKQTFWYWRRESAQVTVSGNNGYRSVSLRLSSTGDDRVLAGEFSFSYDFSHEQHSQQVRLTRVDCSSLTRVGVGEVRRVGPRGLDESLLRRPASERGREDAGTSIDS
jgi:hypothetical protein